MLMEGVHRRSIDHQGPYPRRIGMKQLTKSRKVQDLSRGVQRHHGDHDDVLARFETLRSRVKQHEAISGIVNQVLDDIRRQIRSLPANSDQARSAVRREIDSFRSTLEGATWRISTP